MEIEAKFILPDVVTFQRMQAANHINDFTLSAHQIQQVHDTYLDTEERLILAGGYSCRCRETESEVLITVKELGKATGAIHRRKELEISLPAYAPPSEWPNCPTRNLILQLTAEAPLLPLFDLQQTRVYRRMTQEGLLVAQLSLDNVHITSGNRKQRYFELEIELASQGTQDNLTEIASYLQEKWGLAPEPRSKFERAMAFISENAPGGNLLTAQEHAICVQLAKRDDLYGRRARGLLMLDTGATQDEIAKNITRTPRTIRRWQAAFHQKRLSVFPIRILRETISTPAAILPEMPNDQHSQPESEIPLPPQIEAQSLKTLLERYLVDISHARAVADHALALFDHLNAYHNLTPERRPLVETAALLHNIGLVSDPEKHHTVGRDILLANPPEELNAEERLIVALTTYLHRKQMTYKKVDKKASKPAFSDLSKKARGEALTLAALVRLADGLDYSQSQSSMLGQVIEKDGLLDFKVVGPYADTDAAQAQKKSDLWHLLFKTNLKFSPIQPASELPLPAGEEQTAKVEHEPLPEELPTHPGLSADDTMAEAARKIFEYHFQHMLYHEPGTREGKDIDELHNMRVATRRMRAAFRVFGDHLNMEYLKSILKDLRRTGRKLGTVRDLDVFWEKTQRYLNTLPTEQQNDLAPLQEVWAGEREEAREELLAYLDGDGYAQFKERFAKILQTDEVWSHTTITSKGKAIPHYLRHVVPIIIYKCMANVLAYDEWVTKPNTPLKQLHQLRIEGKQLRYALEFFEEVLSPQAGDMIQQMKKLQDHLGDMQDAVVASELLRDFLTWGTWGRAKDQKKTKSQEPILAPGVATYLADRQVSLYQQLRTFFEVWAYFQSVKFKQLGAAVIETL
ncbi:MAG: hypothetical protein DRI56_10420 [Chloroflexota bacterium]|nr:MAG: hypothetical protein DRI56_10420 [Chloroflexota bacterium]